jgi:2-methylcitrate dehydratase PrpD
MSGSGADLFDFVCDLSLRRIPAQTVSSCKIKLLDYCGVTLFGMGREWSQMVCEAVKELDGSGPCTVIGMPWRTTAPFAALANGTAAHAFELDDCHELSVSHPGAVVISAALAAGEVAGASGADLVEAVVGGYEVMGRAGAAVGTSHIMRGFHPTATSGTFGAAAASAKIFHLDREKFHNAMGLSGSQAGGLMQFSQDDKGTMVKRLHAGLAAERGVLAALLARKGFTGPSDILDGKYGYCRAFSDAPEIKRLASGLGRRYAIDETSIKPAACCHLFHSVIDAVQELRQEYGLYLADPSSIWKIMVGGPEITIAQHITFEPGSPMAAQYSLPYTTAVALLGIVHDTEKSFSAKALANPDILRVARKVEGYVDQEMDDLFPAHYGAKVKIVANDGREFQTTVVDARGTPANPLSFEEVVAKFRGLTGNIFPSRRLEEIIKSIQNIETMADIGTLCRELGNPNI